MRSHNPPGVTQPSPNHFRSFPAGGDWEGGTVDSKGRRWNHIPWQGWQLARPNPFLARPPAKRHCWLRWWTR